MNSIKVCEYSRSRSFHDDLIHVLQDQASGERSQDQWSSGLEFNSQKNAKMRQMDIPASKIFFSETAWPIKVKFYVEHPWVGGTEV